MQPFPHGDHIWDLYVGFKWSSISPTTQDVYLQVVATFIEIFKSDYNIFKHEKEKNNVDINFNSLKERVGDPFFEKTLKDQPDLILKSLSISLHCVIYETESDRIEVDRLVPRLYGYGPLISQRALKSSYIGKFVSVRGTVVSVSNIKPILRYMAYVCKSCKSEYKVDCEDGKLRQPTRCGTRGCKSQTFIPEKTFASTYDWQRVRLQEIVDSNDSGRIPRCIDVELTQDLVDSCVPGDIVTVAGILKTDPINTSNNILNKKKQKTMFYRYIDANSVENAKQKVTGKLDLVDFSLRDLYGIQHIANHNNVFGILCFSICPSIYGHELVKAGLLLSLFGGIQKIADHSGTSVRGDIHVLIVGDPGLGKSQLLKSVSTILPRGVYVGGSYASTTGLTVSIKREQGGHGYALEAGALVLSDQGCCCIDEFDKMPNNWEGLLEAMEQQQISIAKAGIVCNLPARTSIIAAANPHHGHYNKAKTVAQNLKMSAPILSRFDLVFVLLDKADIDHDDLISEHIMLQHQSEKDTYSLASSSSQSRLDPTQPSTDLIKRLRDLGDNGKTTPIPPQLLRKYIGYAKKFVEPKLSQEAIDVLQEFYLTLRKENKSQDGTPVTTRQLESLIRLAEARAKIELREIVTESDAREVIEIMKFSLRDAIDSDGFETVDVLQTGKAGKQKMVSIFMRSLQNKARSSGATDFTTQELYAVAKQINLDVPSFMDFLDLLNQQNYLLKKGPHLYRLYSA